MADDNKKNLEVTKTLSKTIQDLRKEINKTTKDSKEPGVGRIQFDKAQEKAAAIESKLYEAELAGDLKRSEEIRSQLEKVEKALIKGPMNLDVLSKRMEELDAINDNLEFAAKQQEKDQAELEKVLKRDEATRKLSELNESLKSQTDRLDNTTSLQKSLENLQGFFGAAQNETSQELQKAFEKATTDLAAAEADGNKEAKALALQQLEAIQEGAESEEKRREAQKALDEQNDALLKTANGVEGLGNKFDDFASNAAGGVGFLATLAGLALLFLDPQKFAELIGKVITNITNIFSGIYAVFTGDIEGGLGLIKENLGTFAALLGGLVLFLGGPLLKGLSMLLKVARVVRGFVLLTWVPGMVAALSGMATSFMAMLVPFGIIIAAVAGIVLLVIGIKKGLEMLRDSLGFSSVFDVILLGVAHLKDAFGHIANTVGSIVNFIMGIVEKFSSFLGFEIDIPEIPELSTDNAAKKKVELQQKALDQKVEKETPTFDQALEGDGTFDAALNTSGFDLDSLNSENFDLALEGQSAPSLTSVVQNNSPSNRKTTNTTIVEQPTSPGMSILSGLSFSR